MPDQTETMGQRIARLRESKGWSQAELGRRLEVSRMTVNQWESDTAPNIRPVNLLALADIFDTDPYYLVYGPDRGKPKPGEGANANDSSPSGRYRIPSRGKRRG